MEPNEDLNNTPILPVEVIEDKDENAFLLIGGNRYKIDEAAGILINRNAVPRVTFEELLEHIEYVALVTGLEPCEAEDLEDLPFLHWTTVHFKDADHSELTVNGEIGGDYDSSVIESYAYVRMLELSVDKQPEFGKSVSFKSDYKPMYGASFELKVQLNAKTLDDAVFAGMKIVDEIFQPVREAEKFVQDKLNGLKSSQKKS